jgi:hypothetical protein
LPSFAGKSDRTTSSTCQTLLVARKAKASGTADGAYAQKRGSG